MKLKATQWNGIGYVQSTYEGRTAMSDSNTEARFIINYLTKDPVEAILKLKFEYKEDLDEFWDRINHEKSFKILPVEAKNPEGYRIQFRYYSRSPSKPIALAHVSEDTAVAWRVSIEEAIDHIPIKAILFNERFGDKFRIAKHDAYKKKLARISLLEVLQNNLLDRQGDWSIWRFLWWGDGANRALRSFESRRLTMCWVVILARWSRKTMSLEKSHGCHGTRNKKRCAELWNVVECAELMNKLPMAYCGYRGGL